MVPRAFRILAILGLALWLSACSSGAVAVAGPAQSGAIVQDTKTGLVFIAVPVGNSVMVLATAGMSMKAVLKVPPTPSALSLDPHLNRLYVSSDAAGVISVFDSRTFRLLEQRTIGGHPGGLALTAYGKILMVTDSVSGAVLRMTAEPKLGYPAQSATLGPDALPLLAPSTLPSGASTLIWGRGFQANEAVDVYWGVNLLKRVLADSAGIVTTNVTVPKASDLGLHLLILIGQSSTHSASALVSVVHAALPASKVLLKPKAPAHSIMDTVKTLLKPRVSISLAALPAIGPIKSFQHMKPVGGIPVMPILIALVAATSVLLFNMGRKRRKRVKAAPQQAPERRAVPGGRPPARARPAQPGPQPGLRRAS